MRRNVLLLAVVLFFTFGAGTAQALQPMPQEPGFSGFALLGVQATSWANNMISGNDLGDLTKNTVDSLTDKPDTEDSTSGLFGGALRYTFSNLKTQVVLGNEITDYARYEFNSVLGVRHDFGNTGIIGINALVSTFPTEVWEDPYVVGTKRSVTDRTANGVRLDWERIGGTNLEFRFSAREVELDDELSGTDLGLSTSDQDLLDREGDQSVVEFLYTIRLSDNGTLVPNIRYTNQDLDGGAMAGDLYLLRLTYAHRTERYTIVANGIFGSSEYDEENPIYNETREDDRIAAALTGSYHFRPFGREGWSLFADVGYGEEDSNIDFYDTEITYFKMGALYAFK